MKTPLDKLACSIFPRGDGDTRFMAFLTAYFDASGAPADSRFVVVAGYVANVLQWRLAESAWDKVHENAGLMKPFHMTEFQARHREENKDHQYAKWPLHDPRAADFLLRLTAIQQSFALFGVSCIVDMEAYRDVSSVMDLQKVIPPYALGARLCIKALHEWQIKFNILDDIECIFEKGDLGQKEFRHLMIVEELPEPIYRDKKDFAGLQMADMYAWEQSNHLKQEMRIGPMDTRLPFGMMLQIPHIHLETKREDLLSMCDAKEINPKTGFIN